MSADNKSTHWSLTINNPTTDDHADIADARSRGWFVEGQKEQADSTGTVHLQLMLKTPHIRFGAVKKVFKRAHIEPARNPAALKQYVHKEETRVEELDASGDMYPSMAKFSILVLQRYLEDPWNDKDGLDCNYLTADLAIMFLSDKHGYPSYTKLGPDDWLKMLDDATSYLVANGYYVERYAVNPQFRSSWKKFAPAMLCRALQEWNSQIQAEIETRNAKTEPPSPVPAVHPPPPPPPPPPVRLPSADPSPAVEHNHAVCPPQVHPPPPPPPPPPQPCSDPIRHASGWSCSCRSHLPSYGL